MLIPMEMAHAMRAERRAQASRARPVAVVFVRNLEQAEAAFECSRAYANCQVARLCASRVERRGAHGLLSLSQKQGLLHHQSLFILLR